MSEHQNTETCPHTARATIEQLKAKLAHEEAFSAMLLVARSKAEDDRDEARAEVVKLKAELRNAEGEWKHWKKVADHRKEKISAMVARPEPSRLEIAAMLLAGGCANPELATNEDVALAQADALIAASKEEVAK
jgi:hypothetical protein